eukprot:175046_1
MLENQENEVGNAMADIRRVLRVKVFRKIGKRKVAKRLEYENALKEMFTGIQITMQLTGQDILVQFPTNAIANQALITFRSAAENAGIFLGVECEFSNTPTLRPSRSRQARKARRYKPAALARSRKKKAAFKKKRAHRRQVASNIERQQGLNPYQQAQEILGRQPVGAVFSTLNSTCMAPKMIQCLRPGLMLTDEVLNFYLMVLEKRSMESFAENEESCRAKFLTSFFWPKLTGCGYSFNKVKRWTKKKGFFGTLGTNSIFDLDRIFIPIHTESPLRHWMLVCLDMGNRVIEFYNPLKKSKEEEAEHLNEGNLHQCMLQYLLDEHLSVYQQPYADIGQWTYRKFAIGTEIPEQQEKTMDCGIFMCKFVQYIWEGHDFDFTYRDMNTFRWRMILEIRDQRIM